MTQDHPPHDGRDTNPHPAIRTHQPNQATPHNSGAYPAVRPADLTVSPQAADRVRRGIAANTARSYTRCWAQFDRWCATGVSDPDTDPQLGWGVRTVMPATPEALLEYVTYLIGSGKSPATIEQAVAAIRTHHRVAGFKDSPDTAGARLALRGYRKERAGAGLRPRKSAPITIDDLRRMLETCDRTTLAGKRDRALLVIGYALFARRSEVSALFIEDIDDVEAGLDILIRASKTDKDAEGVRIPVRRGAHPDTDPAAILDDWLQALAERGVTSGPLLRAVTRHDGLHPSGAMSGEAVNERIRTLAVRAGIRHADRITAHGLRSGPASTAAKRGTPVSAIADQGRWSPTSPVVYGYIREADRWNQYPDIGL